MGIEQTNNTMIQNKKEILSGENKRAKRICLEVIEYSLKKANPCNEIKTNTQLSNNKLKLFDYSLDLEKIENIYIIGAGKASYSMAKEIESLFSEKITEGVIVTKYDYKKHPLEKIKTLEAGHPIPDENSRLGGKEILQIAEKANEQDLVINLLSGGGSALLTVPVESISLEDIQRTNELLLNCGATINEINTVRKHLSKIKGGKLATVTNPARIISLIVSDVVGDPIEMIASGPTAPDSTTFNDAFNVLEKYSLLEKVPKSVKTHIEKGKAKETSDTPKERDFQEIRVNNLIISNNDKITETAEEKSKELELNTLILSRMIEGESREIGKAFAGILKDIKRTTTPLEPPAIIITGGETTVTIKNQKGEGGPNQEFVLGAASEISGAQNIAIAAIDTDGSDGPTTVAGGIVDGETEKHLTRKGIKIENVLDSNNSKMALEKINGTIVTGPTGTNVNDLRIGIVL